MYIYRCVLIKTNGDIFKSKWNFTREGEMQALAQNVAFAAVERKSLIDYTSSEVIRVPNSEFVQFRWIRATSKTRSQNIGLQLVLVDKILNFNKDGTITELLKKDFLTDTYYTE